MQSAPLHPNEQERLAILARYEVLDTEAEAIFDELTTLASYICGTPISLVSLVDCDRQWFKSRVGLGAEQTDRSVAFCSHAILQDEVFEVENALLDPRFADNPLVVNAPDIRFYAGAPLVAPGGMPIGTLCVIDREPHQLTTEQRDALQILARQVITQLEMRLHARKLQRMHVERERFYALLAHDLRSPFNSILGLSKQLAERAELLSPVRIVKAAHSILSSSLRAYNLLEELLQWSQMQMDEAALPNEVNALGPLIASCIDFISEACELKAINIVNKAPKNMQVFANDAMVKTVLRNLLSNAVKFVPVGGDIVINARQLKSVVEVTVINSGAPMAPDIAKNLFGKNVKSTPGSQGETGCGIGLILCNQFIQQQGGELWLDETYTQGVRMCFTLPEAK